MSTPEKSSPTAIDELNGQRKYVFSSGGEDFYLRVVTTNEEMMKYPKPRMALGLIMYNSHLAKEEELQKEGKTLKISKEEIEEKFHSEEYKERWLTKLLPDGFEHENQKIFILENAEGKFAAAMLFNINDEEKRKALRVDEDVKTFIYASRFIVEPEYRSKRLLSSAFDKVMTMISHRYETPIEYAVSVSAVTASDEMEYVMNLPRYAKMWQARFNQNKLQNRRQFLDDSGVLHQYGTGESVSLEAVLAVSGDVDEEQISDSIKKQRAEVALENVGRKKQEEVRGLYLEGQEIRPYEEVKELRKNLLSERVESAVTRDLEKKDRWSPSTSPKPKDGALPIITDDGSREV